MTHKRTTPKKPPAPKEFEILSSDADWSHMQLMLYGQPGIGKTWLAGTTIDVPEMRPVLLLANDEGYKTVQGKKQFKGINIIRIHTFTAYNKIYEMLSSNRRKWKTVVIDNLGSVHNMAMLLEMEKVVKKDPTREENVPSMREYGIVRAQVHKLVKFFMELNYNLIITAHAELDRDDVEGLIRIRPAVAGKLAYEIPGEMNVVGYLTTQTERTRKGGETKKVIKRVAYFQPHQKIDAKDESDNLGILMENPTMLKIAKAVGLTKHSK